MLLQCCTQYVSKFGKLSNDHRTGKGQFSFQFQRRVMPKNVHTVVQLLSFHMLARLSSIVKARLQEYVNWELPDMPASFEESEGTEIKFIGSWRKQRKSRKNIYFSFIDYVKAFVWITTKCGKLLKKWEYQTTLPASWETCKWVKKQQLELDMKQWIGSKLGKDFFKAIYFHPAYLTYMKGTSCEMPGWMKLNV